MKNYLLIGLLLAACLYSCNKNDDEIIPEEIVEIENHIKAKVGDQDLVIFQDNSLNEDSLNSFSFSFGQVITTYDNSDRADTNLFISGYLNHQQLKVSFPYTKTNGKYAIVRNYGPISTLKGFYSNTINIDKEEGFINFETTNFLQEDIPETKIGELEITTFDLVKREVAGTFHFDAYGYFYDWQSNHPKISAVDSVIHVKQGSFYYKWDEELKISTVKASTDYPVIFLGD